MGGCICRRRKALHGDDVGDATPCFDGDDTQCFDGCGRDGVAAEPGLRDPFDDDLQSLCFSPVSDRCLGEGSHDLAVGTPCPSWGRSVLRARLLGLRTKTEDLEPFK